MSVLIECDALSYRYEQSPGPAVKDVSFTVDEGDYVCVVGENGSGKSTLIRMLVGLTKPTGGSIAFKALGRREVGYLPQQTPVQKDFPASVREVVLTGRLNRKRFLTFTTKKDVIAAEANLDKLGVLDLKRRPYRDLSGGQRQRVLLARALCASEKLLVLDEPVTGLDPLAQEEMYKVIGDLNRDGMTIVMVSHDVTGAVRMAGKILHMDTEARYFGSVDGYLRSAPGRRFLSQTAAGIGAPDGGARDSSPYPTKDEARAIHSGAAHSAPEGGEVHV